MSDIEAPAEDAFEQELPADRAHPVEDDPIDEVADQQPLPTEADEADAADQDREVGFDEEDYR